MVGKFGDAPRFYFAEVVVELVFFAVERPSAVDSAAVDIGLHSVVVFEEEEVFVVFIGFVDNGLAFGVGGIGVFPFGLEEFIFVDRRVTAAGLRGYIDGEDTGDEP